MKKIIILSVSLILICSNVFAWKANFDYGKDTYEKWDNVLIVNSLGDETVESKFNYKSNKLGYNDYIPENAFKNNLHNEGYSKVYDFNNPNLDLTPVGYMGRLGNPRSYDEDYVLTSEWKKYSSQYQDVRINQNKNYNDYQDMKLNTNKNNILKNKKEIVNVNNKHTNWNNNQDNNIVNNSNNINTNQNNISNNLTKINNNTNKINNLDNRVSELEETQYIVGLEGRIYDSKKWQVNIFADYSTNRQKIDRTGIRFTFKFGKSYEEKKIDKLEKQLKDLMKKNQKESD